MREKKWIALLLAFVMMLAPMTVFAEEDIWAPAEEENEAGEIGIDVLERVFGRRDFGQRNDLRDLLKDNFEKQDEIVLIVEMDQESSIDVANARGIALDELSDAEAIEMAALSSQEGLFAELENRGVEFEVVEQYTSVLNAAAIRVKAGDYDKIADLSGIEEIFFSNTYNRPEAEEVNSRMKFSHNMIFDREVWKMGIRGEGSVVAVMDTGADYLHPDFQTLTKPADAKLDKTRVDRIVRENNLRGKWFTAKIPYAYNYYDRNDDIKDSAPGASMHGMHVAGTVAANGAIKGVAPEAQVLVMKVFGNDPLEATTMDYVYVKAIDDALKLGADVVNMSLGSPAGFNNPKSATGKAITKAVDNGIVFAISAGNSGTSMGDSMDFPYEPENPDISTVGAPSVFKDSTSVASVNNSEEEASYIRHNNENLIAIPTTNYVPSKTLTEEYSFLHCGLGTEDEIPAEVRGKVALIRRGDFSFKQKIVNAEAKGAIAVVIYNSAGNSGIQPLGGVNNVGIPSIAISHADGLKMVQNLAAGRDKVSFPSDTVGVPAQNGGMMSRFSSWGPTPNLELKPEITAPGGNIYSTLNDGEYGMMSGTSMAAPHVAGAFALVNQYIRDNLFTFKYNKVTVNPNVKVGLREIPDNSFIIGTKAFHENILNGPHAQKLYDAMDEGHPLIYKARGKYYGMNGEVVYKLTQKITFMNAYGETSIIDPNASASNAVVSNEPLTKGDTTRLAKVLLMNTATHLTEGRNFPVSPRQQGAGLINVEAAVKTPAVLLDATTNEPKAELKNIESTSFDIKLRVVNAKSEPLIYNVSAITLRDHVEQRGAGFVSYAKSMLLDSTVSGDKTVEVPANGFKDFTVTVDFAGEDIRRNMYIEGFVNLKDANDTHPDLTIPFLGFYGNYSEPSMMYEWRILGEKDTTFALGNRLPFGIWIVGDFVSGYVKPGSVGYVTPNPNLERIKAQLVPDYQALRMFFALRRNAEQLQYRLLDEQGEKEIGVIDTTHLRRKNYRRSPHILGPVFDGTLNGRALPDGRYTYEVRAKAYMEGSEWQSKRVPIVIDGTGPEVTAKLEGDKLIIEATDEMTAVLNGLIETNAGQTVAFDYMSDGLNGRKVGRKDIREVVNIANLKTDGDFMAKVMFFDELGNATTVAVGNGEEEQQPNIYVNTPGSFSEFGVTAETVDVSFYVFDTKFQPNGFVNDIKVNEVKYVANAEIKDANDDIMRSGPAYLFNISLPISDFKPGYNEVKIKAITVEGKYERSIIRPIFVDQSAPEMTLTVKDRAADSDKAIVNVQLKDDVSPGGTLYINGSEKLIIDHVDFYDEMNGFEEAHDIELELQPGENQFTFRFVDLFGNITVKTITVTRE